MVMNPRTHPRGARPDFTLPRPNPSPQRMTDALWWLVCMRLELEPKSRNGGTYTDKPGSHNIGGALPDHGQGSARTDHSIRDAFNRTGPWWRTKTAAHDWTFVDAQAGDFTTITLYTRRLITAMRDPDDPRPDDTYFYTLGQADNDRVIEGYNERDDDAEASSDDTHLWHRHDSFRRNIIGSFWHMWKALTIDMGWTVAEWRTSLQEDDVTPEDRTAIINGVAAKMDDVVIAVLEGERGRRAISEAVARTPVINARKLPDGTDQRTTWIEFDRYADVRADRALAAVQALAVVVRAMDAREAAEVPPAALDNARATLDALGAAGSSPQQTAAALRAVLGDRADEVGRLLAGAGTA
jgi:hypothetical protein